MKKILLGLLLTCGAIQTGHAESVCSTLVVTGPPAGPPSSWVMKGELVGASVDLVKEIARGAGVKNVEIKTFPTWNDALEATNKGQVDLIFSAAWSVDRARNLNFVQPAYASQFLYVVVLKGKSFSLLKYDDLEKKKGAAGKGETFGDSKFGQYVEKKLDLVRTNSTAESFDLLLDGKVDYIFGYENAVYSEVYNRNITGKVDYVSTYPYETDTYFAFSKRSKCYQALAEPFSNGVVKANKEKIYYRLMNKYRALFDESTLESK